MNEVVVAGDLSTRPGRVAAILCWLGIVLGAALRLDQYLINRSMWLDEAMLAVNFLDRTPIGLLRPPLDYNSHLNAPSGFLAATSLLVTLFGDSDLVFRLLPFVCGLVSLFLFYRLARTSVSPIAVPVAVVLFGLSGSAIYYASEFKQYSSDLTVVLALLIVALRFGGRPLTPRRALGLALVGAVAVWFSHPAAFVLLAVGAYLGSDRVCRGTWPAKLALGLIGVVWLASFLVMYLLSEGSTPPSAFNEYLLRFWEGQNAFMPSPLSLASLRWVFWRFLEMFSSPGSSWAFPLAAALFVAGCVALKGRAGRLVVLLVVPIAAAMAASFFRLYPFSGRLLLFALPAIYLAMAEGIAQILVRCRTRPVAWAVGGALVLAVVSQRPQPLYSRSYVQEMKPILRYVQQHRSPTDVLYLYHWSEPAFRHYARAYGFDYDACRLITPIPKNPDLKEVDYFREKRGARPVVVSETRCVLGVSEFVHLAGPDLEQLRGQGRVWFVFSHAGTDESRFVQYLDEHGTRLASLSRPGASAYLYAL